MVQATYYFSDCFSSKLTGRSKCTGTGIHLGRSGTNLWDEGMMFRGSVYGFSQFLPTGPAFSQCTACSSRVIQLFKVNRVRIFILYKPKFILYKASHCLMKLSRKFWSQNLTIFFSVNGALSKCCVPGITGTGTVYNIFYVHFDQNLPAP
jgi:hypothetical protein